jgi:hypothetical protein
VHSAGTTVPAEGVPIDITNIVKAAFPPFWGGGGSNGWVRVGRAGLEGGRLCAQSGHSANIRDYSARLGLSRPSAGNCRPAKCDSAMASRNTSR